jgi:gibberellin A4 carboxyl methyltransferase
MPATTGMKGGGYYDEFSTAQGASINAVAGWLDRAAAGVALPASPRPIVVLDLGSSEGRNALAGMGRLVAGLRRRTEQPIQTVYSDLPTNNFNRLFANLEEARRAGRYGPEVYPGAVAGSFYTTLAPPGTVHLATSFNAVLWMDRLPAPIDDFVSYRRPVPPRRGLNPPPEVIEVFTRQAAQDWARFLDCRARELASGGKLIVATPGDAPDGRICDGIYDLLNDSWLDLVATGDVPRDVYDKFTMPVYFRTESELRAPLEEGPLGNAFTIDRSETMIVKTPFLAAFDQTGDAEVLAKDYAGFLRAISEPVVAAALEHRENRQAAIEALYDRAHARVLAEPKRYHFRYIQVAIELTRR